MNQKWLVILKKNYGPEKSIILKNIGKNASNFFLIMGKKKG